jgi:hypothetical protein
MIKLHKINNSMEIISHCHSERSEESRIIACFKSLNSSILIRNTFLNSIIHYICLLLFISIIISCSHTKHTTEDAKIIGKTNWNEWIKKSGWTEFDAKDFNPPSEKINKIIKLNNKNIKYIIFASTFCDECREQLPKLFKIFNLAKINDDGILLYGLDGNLQEPTGTYKNYKINTTPTLFIQKNNKVYGGFQFQDYLWLDAIIEVLEKN